MTLLQKLQAHKGGLIRLKTQLFWYGGRGFDGTPGRLCLLLDADAVRINAAATPIAAAYAAVPAADTDVAHTLLLIDGRVEWVGVAEGDVEVVE